MIDTLKSQLMEAANDFHNGRPMRMTDAKFDEIELLIKESDPDWNYRDHIVYDVDGIKIDRRCHFPSMDKSTASDRTYNKLSSYGKYLMPKWDGSDVVAFYRNGEVYKIASSGHSDIGISQFNKLKNKVVNPVSPSITEVYYQAVVHKDVGKRENANGLINSKYLQSDVDTKLILLPCECYTPNNDLEVIDAFMNLYVHQIDNEEFDSIMKTGYDANGYPCDGIVSWDPINNRILARKIYYNESVETTVKGHTMTFSKDNGTHSAVLKIAEVKVENAKINNVKYGPIGSMKEDGVGIGSRITIVRSGKVIPHVLNIVSKSTDFSDIRCTSCKSELEPIGKDMFCTNMECSGMNNWMLRRVLKQYLNPQIELVLINQKLGGPKLLESVKKYIDESNLHEEIQNKINASNVHNVFNLIDPPRFIYRKAIYGDNKTLFESKLLASTKLSDKIDMFIPYLSGLQKKFLVLTKNRLFNVLTRLGFEF